MFPSLMNEGNRGTKPINQTTEILVWWKKLGNGKLEKGKDDLEKLKI